VSGTPETGADHHVALELMVSLSDAAGVSATFLMTAPIAETLLFAGRLADLYPPHRVYTIGFIGLAIFYLIISFMTDQYAFFVLRSVSALLAVWTIPSSINMIGE
jgi:MFS family permease